MTSPQVYTTAEVCAILKCSRSTVYTLAQKGRITQVLRGRYTIASVERFLTEGTPEPERIVLKRPTQRKSRDTKQSRIPIPTGRKISFES